MGGPFYTRREAGAWTVPKGEYDAAEPALRKRPGGSSEELGLPPPDGEAVPLGEVRQAGGKVVTVWAVEADLDRRRSSPAPSAWSGRRGRDGSGVPRAGPGGVVHGGPGREVIVKAQAAFLDQLAEHSH